jgi:glycosyltransferase involved in cell wall biosynthesis
MPFEQFMERKHILFISSWYPNRNNPTHGIFNRYFAEACSKFHHISIIHVCSEENLKTDFEITETQEDNITTVIIYYRKINSQLPLISSLLKHRRLISGFEQGCERILKLKGKPDLIQLNVVMPAGIGAHHLSTRYNIPLIVNENWSGYMPEDGNYKGFFLKHFTEKIIRHAKMIVPVSLALKEAMLSHGLEGNYHIIPNVVNVSRFVPQAKSFSDTVTLLHISTLDDNPKNVSGIIRAFANVKDHKVILNIIGEGPEAAQHQQLVRDLKLGNRIHFLGRRMGQELVDEMNKCDALLMFSFYETFSLVMAEAFSCGKPVISSKVGIAAGMPAELGITVEKGNEKALTEAVEKFIQNKSNYNPDVIRNYAIKHYSSEFVGAEFDRVYREVLGA